MSNATVAFDTMQITFSWLDYSLLLVMLSLSILIGFYFWCCGHQDTASEYLLGGKEMTAIPIGVSLVASNISGIALLGFPTDIYRFGSTFGVYIFTLLPMCFITFYVYIPVFYKLQVVSAYEYFAVRFDRKLRLFASGLYILNTLLYLPIVVYIPALALAQATHISHHYITPIVCGVCILYTTIGGLKAVVWTDTLQFVVMIGSVIGVFYHGVRTVGGFNEVFQRAEEGQRFDFDFDLDPTKRDTVLAASIGTFILGFCYCTINQSFIQKFLSMPTMNDIKKALGLFYIGMVMILLLVYGIGIVMYAHYHQCDPFTAGKIAKPDQVLPFYVMEVATAIPGLAGLFLSGILSAALSTLSACMNSLAASIYEDFVSPFVPANMGQKKISNILKLLVILIGLGSTLMVYVVENLGAIVPINFALSSITNGPLLGLFTLGMLFPSANSKGAFYGSILSMSIMTFIIGGGKYHELNGNLKYDVKPMSIAGCNGTATISTPMLNNIEPRNDVFVLFKITHYYYTFLGAILTILTGVVISYFTRDREENKKVNPDTISPAAHWIMQKLGIGKDYLDSTKDYEMTAMTPKEAESLITQVQHADDKTPITYVVHAPN